ncbi:MAG: response regulator transcription factor [Ignavibacteriaceae bacterium]|nr:response regulator transcription factor [Ignavibacteriaceae bacterium]
MENKKIRIVVVDDHALLRSGLIELINKQSHLEVIGEASDGNDAIEKISKLKPDIAIMDIQMPKKDGFEAAQIILKTFPTIKVIFLTMYKEEKLIKKVFELGIKGYILKESAIIDVINCIDAVSRDEFYLSPQVSHLLLSTTTPKQTYQELTATENQIIGLISKGKSSQEIADELFISIKTVGNHRGNICKKLGITGNSALLKFALKRSNEEIA